jgi:hypothetical protein
MTSFASCRGLSEVFRVSRGASGGILKFSFCSRSSEGSLNLYRITSFFGNTQEMAVSNATAASAPADAAAARASAAAAAATEAFAKAGRDAASKGHRVAAAAGPVDVKMPGGASEPQRQSSVHPESAYRRDFGEKLPGLEALEISDPDKVQGHSKKIYLDRSCCVLRPASLLRRLCIYLVEWKLFEPIILMATFVNCVAIALESPSEVKSKLKESFITVREHSSLTLA